MEIEATGQLSLLGNANALKINPEAAKIPYNELKGICLNAMLAAGNFPSA